MFIYSKAFHVFLHVGTEYTPQKQELEGKKIVCLILEVGSKIEALNCNLENI